MKGSFWCFVHCNGNGKTLEVLVISYIMDSKYRVIKSLCAPDDYNTGIFKANLTAWHPSARARWTLDSH
jgi:hypothetical protein